MKLAKRALALCIVLVMALALIACSTDTPKTTNTGKVSNPTDSTGNTDSTHDPKINVFTPPERPTSETADQTYIIIQHDSPSDPFGYGADTQNAQLALERIDEVQDLYGCTIEFEAVSYGGGFASAIQARAYSENGGDMIFATNNASLRTTLGKGGDDSYMVDLLTVDNIINFWDTEKWGSITAKETMMSGGHFYGVSPNLWMDCTPLPFYILVYNKDMLEQFGVQDLQEYWEAGEWNRDNMIDAITHCLDNSGADPIWGMSATLNHMVRATVLSTGVQMVQVEKVNADGSVNWTYGLDDPDVEEALLWLRSTLNANRPYFNNGKETVSLNDSWLADLDLVNNKAAMCLTRPKNLFDTVVKQIDNFGLITWAAADDNVMTGYFENCYSIAIPVFAQNVQHSAFLMYDLFEGLGDIESYNDVIKYYRDRYFESDLDVQFLLRDGATLQYSYWPNNADFWLTEVTNGIFSTTGIQTLISKAKVIIGDVAENYILPNQVALAGYREAGKID